MLLVVGLALLVTSCDWIEGSKRSSCPSFRIVSHAIYSSPSWHPDGFVTFNYTPLDSITYPYGEHCMGRYHYDAAATGFWRVDAKGTSMRRITRQKFGAPAWSPDGEWLAFNANAQIYKIHFSKEGFEPSSLTQLTDGGHNFFPAWSPDGQWIAHDKTKEAGRPYSANECSIYVTDGSANRCINKHGRYPSFSSDGEKLAFVTTLYGAGLREKGAPYYTELFRVSLQDTSELRRLTTFAVKYDEGVTIKNPMYSPDGSKIAFWMQRQRTEENNYARAQIWLMNTDGSGLQHLVETGYSDFDWRPDGKRIVYVQYYAGDWSYENGTLWTINVETGRKRQLTSNPKAHEQ